MTTTALTITWLTQAGFLFRAGPERLVVDPYLSDAAERELGWTRLVAPPLKEEDLNPGAILCTHDHLDHLDPESLPRLMELNPGCVLAGPPSVFRAAPDLGLDLGRVLEMEPGRTRDLGSFRVTAVPAKHSDPWAVGFLIRQGGWSIYFSGDSLYYPELPGQVADLAQGRLDLALVCINGRMGNMTWEEALELVSELRPRLTAPIHYGLFAENTADPEPFVQGCGRAGLNCTVLEPGRPVSLEQAIKDKD